MRTYNSSCDPLDRVQPTFVSVDSRTSEQRSTRWPNASTRPEQHRSFAPDIRMPPTLRNEMAKLLTDIINSPVSSKREHLPCRLDRNCRASTVSWHTPVPPTLPATIRSLGDAGGCLRSAIDVRCVGLQEAVHQRDIFLSVTKS